MWKKLKRKIQLFNEYDNPFMPWWKVRKIFKKPKVHLYIGKKTWFFGLPIRDEYYNRIISIHTSSLGWKYKYDEVRHEWDPYIHIRLFGKWDLIWVFNYIDKNNLESSVRNIATWEAMLDYLYNNKTIEQCKDYHIWGKEIGNPNSKEITIDSNIL